MSGGWIHSFAVTDTQTHKNGYTIYKITSIVFPRAIPEALTCITVWKRFHDIKRLHRELSRRQKSLKIRGKMPEPTDSTYFKRFDKEIIQRRKDFIISFLDFVAQHPPLYKCHLFFQFFNDHSSELESPLRKLHAEKGGNNSLYSRLDPNECYKGDKVANVGLGSSISKPEPLPNQDSALPVEDEPNLPDDTEKDRENLNDTKPTKDYARFLTPMASIESEDSDYIYEAALEFSHAVQAEANLEYSEAHMRYKRGVELLLNGSKNDINDERKFIAKTKISKYLARADDIHEKFLCGDNESNDIKRKVNVQLTVEGSNNENAFNSFYIERPLNHLAKYKVLKVLGHRVIKVQCVTDRQRPTYVIKGIEKPSSNAPTQTIFLPQHVPYMVNLLAFFQSEQKIYLLLRHAECGRLIDYVQSYDSIVEKPSKFDDIFPDVNECNIDSFGKDSIQDSLQDSTEHSEIIRTSQLLLKSVANTLSKVKIQEEKTSPEKDYNEEDPLLTPPLTGRKLKGIPEACIKQWAAELFVAIESLHEKGVILGDLHMHNLLLGEKGQLLLTYFYQTQVPSEETGNPYAQFEHYVAPERPLSLKSDWWSYGVVLYQLLLGVSFKSMHPGRIDIYGYVQYPEDIEISSSSRDLLDNLLRQLPEERYGEEDIRSHTFFENFNWNEIRQNGFNNSLYTSS